MTGPSVCIYIFPGVRNTDVFLRTLRFTKVHEANKNRRIWHNDALKIGLNHIGLQPLLEQLTTTFHHDSVGDSGQSDPSTGPVRDARSPLSPPPPPVPAPAHPLTSPANACVAC